MEDNLIYSSVGNACEFGSIFVVDIEENETSLRLNLKGEYSLKVGDGGLSLLTLNTDKTLFTWLYTVLRRYGTSKTGFTFEAGRKSQTGPGVLRFSSPSGKLITQTIKRYVNRIKGDNSAPYHEPPSITSFPKPNTCQDEMSGDYTEYSRTTGRPKHAVPKPVDPQKELSLEFPRQYINQRLVAGPTLSHPVNVIPQIAPRNLNNPISPYGVTPSKSSYNTIGPQTVLVDSYSELSSSQSLQPAFANFNQNVPFFPDVMNQDSLSTNLFYTPPPSIPLPYNSLRRPKQFLDSKDTTLTNDFIVSCETTASTFPACVSPDLKTDSGEDSSDGEVASSNRKISQASTCVKELSADLELTTIQESEDYINLKNTPLDRSLSNPVNREDVQIIETAAPIPKYLNVAPQSGKNPNDDYYNIASVLFEDRKRSNTDTDRKSSPDFNTEKKLNFSLTPGPATFSSVDDLFKSENTSKSVDNDEIAYGNVQFFPSSPQPTREQFYVNAPIQFKPSYENVPEHKRLDHDYIAHPASFESQTLPPSPTKPCLVTSISQPSTIKLKSRPTRQKPVSSQYSFLTEVLGNAPRSPQAYTWKSQNSEYND